MESLALSLSVSRTSKDKAIGIILNSAIEKIKELEMRLEISKIARINEEIKKAKQKAKTSNLSTDPIQLVLFTTTLS